MPLALFRYALAKDHPEDSPFRWTPDLKKSSTSSLSERAAIAPPTISPRGIADIAAFGGGWLAGGTTARNTTIIRANSRPKACASTSAPRSSPIFPSPRRRLPRCPQSSPDIAGRTVFHLLVDSAAALYFYNCLLDAAAEFGGRIAGLDVLQKFEDV